MFNTAAPLAKIQGKSGFNLRNLALKNQMATHPSFQITETFPNLHEMTASTL